MSQEMFDLIESKLSNGWVCGLVSTVTPGIFRIQLMSPGEFEPGWRKCIDASTFDQALDKASEFTKSITWQDYGAQVMK